MGAVCGHRPMGRLWREEKAGSARSRKKREVLVRGCCVRHRRPIGLWERRDASSHSIDIFCFYAPLTEMLNRQGDECNGQSPLAAFAISLVNSLGDTNEDRCGSQHVRLCIVKVNAEKDVSRNERLLMCQIWSLS